MNDRNEPTATTSNTALVRPLLVNVRDTQRQLGNIARSTVYTLLNHGQLRGVHVGVHGSKKGRRMILQESIDQYVAGLAREAEENASIAREAEHYASLAEQDEMLSYRHTD